MNEDVNWKKQTERDSEDGIQKISSVLCVVTVMLDAVCFAGLGVFLGCLKENKLSGTSQIVAYCITINVCLLACLFLTALVLVLIYKDSKARSRSEVEKKVDSANEALLMKLQADWENAKKSKENTHE